MRLQQVRGIGPLTATALLPTVGDASQFSNGLEMAASFGLTPKQNSSGGKERLLGISKRGGCLSAQFAHAWRPSGYPNGTSENGSVEHLGDAHRDDATPEYCRGSVGEQDCPYSLGNAHERN